MRHSFAAAVGYPKSAVSAGRHRYGEADRAGPFRGELG
jgi:hypothetical protein